MANSEEKDIKRYDKTGIDYTLNREKRGISCCPYKLRAQRMIAGRHRIYYYKPDITSEFLDGIKQWNGGEKQQ